MIDSPFHATMRRLLPLTVVLSVLALSAEAQEAGPSPRDSIFRRARRMVTEGNGAAGRTLVDSLLKLEAEGTMAYGDALYWRGALAPTASEAERDYRRVIVEYPLSYYAGDALLGIAGLEQARGERANALQHMVRYVREHPENSPTRGNAAYGAARLAFEQKEFGICSAMIVEARKSASAKDIELKNQIDYVAARCPATVVASEAPVVPPPQSPPKDSSAPPPVAQTPVPRTTKPVVAPPKPPVKSVTKPPVEEKPTEKVPEKLVEKSVAPAPPPATKPVGIYTIQLAAFNTLPEAERLVAALGKRDVAARVSGDKKPFRVRLQFYATRQAAAAEVAALKARGIISFVTTEEPPTEKTTP